MLGGVRLSGKETSAVRQQDGDVVLHMMLYLLPSKRASCSRSSVKFGVETFNAGAAGGFAGVVEVTTKCQAIAL